MEAIIIIFIALFIIWIIVWLFSLIDSGDPQVKVDNMRESHDFGSAATERRIRRSLNG